MNKIKKHLNIIKKTILTIMATFVAVSLFDITPLKAKTPTVEVKNEYPMSAVVKSADGYHETWWSVMGYIYIDGEIAFCIEPEQFTSTGASYTATEFTAQQKYQLELISYVGWELSDKTDEDYTATQFMIWELLGNTIESTSFSDYSAKKKEIQNKIDKLFYSFPSFRNKTVELDIGESITLTDTNGVFSNYSLDSKSTGITVSKSGNKLTITATKNAPENAKVSYQLVKDNYVGTSMKYYSPVSQDVVVLKQEDPRSFNINVKVNKYGSLKITKQDEDGTLVPNTSFKVSANSDMSDPIGTYTTGSDGTVTIEDLTPATYYVQEVSVPSHLVLDSTIHQVTVQSNQTATFTGQNNWKKGKVLIRKTDKDSNKQVPDAVYAIFNADTDKEVTRLTTLANGYVSSEYLRFGEYYVKEVIAPNGYVLNDTKYPVTISENEQKIEITGVDERVRGTINIEKQDSVTGDAAQGEATLAGATYGLYAKENILDPADQSIVYHADELLSELTIDAQHKASVSDLYLGKYYLKEIEASEGYTLDETEYNVVLSYQGQTTATVTVNQTVKERVKAQAFQLIKVSDNNTGETDLLEGVEFTIKAQKDIDQYGSWEKAPIAKNAEGKEASILVTDEKGYAVSDELPYGTYVVRETKAPDDHYAIPDFTVVINEDSRDPQPWRVFNDEKFRAVIAMVKLDADTGKTVLIEGSTFKIRNLSTNEYVGYWGFNPFPAYITEWVTDAHGIVMTGTTLEPGEYQIEEIKAPNGYVLNEGPVKFKVSSNTAYETLPDGSTPVITVKMSDQAVKGQIQIEKRGEVLVDFKDGQFIYEERGLEGMTAEVIAREDILDPSNDGTVLYPAGTLMDTITTDQDGKGLSKELPLGKYEVHEITAPEGYVLNDEVKYVELSYKDQTTSVVFSDLQSYFNERQKIELNILKTDDETDIGLEGAVYGLYAKQDVINADGDIILKADSLIEKSISDVNGELEFNADLPLGDYYVKEIQAPIGYASSNEVFEVSAVYKGQDVSTITFSKTFKNAITKIEVSKKDITNEEEIAGAFLTVYPKDDEGAIYASWVSGQDGVNEDGTIKPHMIKGLEVGKTYILKEISSPHGYALAQDVEFTISDTGEIQKVEMKDELVVGQLKWKKSGEIFDQVITGQTEFGKTESPVWNKSNLLGAKITIYAAEDIKIGNHTFYKADEEIQTLESDWDYVFSKELPVGRYFYKETTTPHGYVIDTNKHFFEIEDNQINEIQVIESTLKNERHTFDIDMTKVLEEQEIFKDEDAYKDIVFGIFAREDIYDYMGNIAIENGTMITTTGITREGHLETVPDLPNGVYYLKELATNDQYVLNDTEYDFEIGYKGQDVSHYVVTISFDGKIPNELARGDIYVHKKDSSDPDKVMKDIEFNISIHEDISEIIQTAKTNEEGIASFRDLELGTYYIQEAKQIDGYVINDHIYKVEVKQDGDVLTIICENKPTEMEFSKVDITTGKELPGAKMQVTDKETGKIIDEWISTDEPHKIRYLVEGKEYILTEKIAPEGYELAESITFTAKDNTKIIMKDKLIPEAPDTGEQTNLGLWLGLMGISLFAVFALLSKNRKKDENNGK